MVVVVILGILAAIVLVTYNDSRLAAAKNAHDTNVSNLITAANVAISNNNGPPSTSVTWQGSTNSGTDPYLWNKYVQAWPSVPQGLTNANTAYKVVIGTDSTIIVTPGLGSY